MKLKYVGPKPVISEHGVSFKDGKDDKYVYIKFAIDILNALNHNYQKGHIYKHDIEDLTLSDEEIETIILNYKPQLLEDIEKDIESYNVHLDEEIENLETSHKTLNETELYAFKNNLKIMKEYRVQRAINKIYYMNIIEIIAEIIKEHKIRNITTPFNERHWHILQTLQGALGSGKNYIKTELEENEDSTLELKINII